MPPASVASATIVVIEPKQILVHGTYNKVLCTLYIASVMELRTPRLLLREYIADDLEAMLAFESDPLVVQYVCYGPYSREECWQQLEYHRIFATCHPKNARSIHVLEKLGMRYEGCLRAQKSCRGQWRDVAIYALLDEEWQV